MAWCSNHYPAKVQSSDSLRLRTMRSIILGISVEINFLSHHQSKPINDYKVAWNHLHCDTKQKAQFFHYSTAKVRRTVGFKTEFWKYIVSKFAPQTDPALDLGRTIMKNYAVCFFSQQEWYRGSLSLFIQSLDWRWLRKHMFTVMWRIFYLRIRIQV